MQVVQSIYSFDEKVLIYAKYVELLQEILDKVTQYYEKKAEGKWGTIAYISGFGIAVCLGITWFFYRHQHFVYMLFSIVGAIICAIITGVALHYKTILENRSKQYQVFVNNEISQITIRDNDTRSLRLIERRGFENIIDVEEHSDGHYVYFEEEVYDKPCLIDKIYFKDNENCINLSVYDDYYSAIEERIRQLKSSKTLHDIEKLLQQ